MITNTPCSYCNESPCLWTRHQDEVIANGDYFIVEQTESEGKTPSPNIVRKECYRVFTWKVHGYLAKETGLNHLNVQKTAFGMHSQMWIVTIRLLATMTSDE